MKQMKRRRKAYNVAMSTSALLFSVIVTGTVMANSYSSSVNSFLGTSEYKEIKDENADPEDSIYFKSDYADEEEAREAGQNLGKQIETEGAVLAKNDGILPLKNSKKVTLFGKGSVDTVFGGSGSSATGDNNKKVTLQEALEEVGIEANQEMIDFYQEMGEQEEYTRVSTENVTGEDWRLGEVGVDKFTDAVKTSYSEYSDAAIVVLTRAGGEGADLPSGKFLDGENYLKLQDCEKELIQEAEANFDKVIVLVNSANTMELKDLQEDDKIDAIVWMGTPGDTGMYGIADLLVGNSNFSGRFTDTYVTDNRAAAAAQNEGNFTYANADQITESGAYAAENYVVESEGIYVGYRYYETRYEDCILDQGNADGTAGSTTGKSWNYDDEVVYPFGYGLSYTSFEQKLDDVVETDSGFTVKVTVTNTGDTAGKDVVQVYGQSPYTEYDQENGVEKASVNLVGYGKTDMLEAGSSQTLEIEVDKNEFTSYDYKGYQTYILEAGDYYLSVGDDAHDALNNILSDKMADDTEGAELGQPEKTYKWTETETDTETYAVSDVTGTEITNQLSDVDLNYYGDMVTYLTRNDWDGTFPQKYEDLEATQEMIEDLNYHNNYEPGDSDTSSIKTGEDNDVQLITLRGKDYDDPMWEDLLDELTIDEMAQFLGQCGFGYNAIPSIGLKETNEQDGPVGVSGNSIKGVGYGMTKYPCTVLLASTFNDELAYEYGKMLGNEALQVGVQGLYAPGLNIHRTAYSGRNFEYFSEDPLLSGQIAAQETIGCNEKGFRLYGKHFALNDQEDNRRGVSTFANEQAIREIYLKSFEITVKDGNITGLMNAYNRVGCKWTGAEKGLLTNILQEEWGFKGDVLTDLDFSTPTYEPRWLQTSGGTHSFAIANDDYELLAKSAKEDSKLLSAMRENMHRSLYVIVNSSTMNGVGENDVTEKVTPWWRTALVAADIVFLLLFVGSVFTFVKCDKKMKKELQNSAEVGGEA